MDVVPEISPKRRYSREPGSQVALQSEPWYNDGNVVIQADGGTAFRVHQGVLIESSTVLKDMLKESESMKPTLFGGCPILYLRDPPTLVKDVITACYSRSLAPRLEPPAFDVVVTMLHLGRKYGIRHLTEEAISRLRAEFPSKLSSFDEDNNWTKIEEPEDSDSADLLFLDCANIAREYALLDLLPSLLVHLLDIDVEEILKGLLRADGSRAILCYENQHSWILGFEGLRNAQYEETFGHLQYLPYPGCSSPKSCSTFKEKQIEEFVAPPTTLAPVQPWSESWDEQLCPGCRKLAKKSHSKGRRRVWASLPSFFDLPPWKELEDAMYVFPGSNYPISELKNLRN